MDNEAKESRLKNVPARPMNKWVRDALIFSGKTLEAVAEMLEDAGVGSYNRSAPHKMIKTRKVSLDEAVAISTFTGFPLPRTLQQERIIDGFDKLSDQHQQTVQTVINGLLAAQKAGSGN